MRDRCLDCDARLLVFADGVAFVARQDSARTAITRRYAYIRDGSAVLASAYRSATSARLKVGERVKALRFGAKDTPNRARGHTSRAEMNFRTRHRLFLVLRDGPMALGVVNGGALARLRTGRSRGSGFAALGIWVPFPVRRAAWNRGWRRMLGYAATLLAMPIPVRWAVVAARRERRRWVPVREAARTTAPPPLVVAAVVISWGRSSRRAAGIGTGVPDPTVATRGLAERRSIPRRTAVGFLVPEPQSGALVSRRRAGRG